MAHGYRDPRTRQEDLLRRFLDGLCDDNARFHVEYVKDPNSIDEAVYHVVNFVETKNPAMETKSKRHSRRISWHDNQLSSTTDTDEAPE